MLYATVLYVVFYTTVSNDVNVSEDNLQSFLIETRITDKRVCVYCSGEHVVKNGTRKDGTQRYLCRDFRKSFILSSHSVTSRTKKHLSVWAKYLRCMMEKKTLAETAEECHIALSTSFAWRHKILASLGETADKVCPEDFVLQGYPHHALIEMIAYKAAMAGIAVRVTEESYTSGTSYLDGEYPDRAHYDIRRRIARGLFMSNDGTYINADVNAAYQIMKAGGIRDLRIKKHEKITRINVA